MKKTGYVIDDSNGRLVLDVRRSGSCGDKCKTCKSSCEVKIMRVDVENKLGAKKGDLVSVKMKTDRLLGSTFLMYVMPIIFFVTGMAISYSFLGLKGDARDLVSFAVGAMFMAAAFVIVRKIGKRVKDDDLLDIEDIIG